MKVQLMVAKYTADVKESPTAQSAKSSQTQNAVNLLILYIMKINVQRWRKLLMRNILFYFDARNTFQKKLQQWHGVLPLFVSIQWCALVSAVTWQQDGSWFKPLLVLLWVQALPVPTWGFLLLVWHMLVRDVADSELAVNVKLRKCLYVCLVKMSSEAFCSVRLQMY